MAVYFEKYNILYCHVPKTGGCTLYSVLDGQKIPHEGAGYQHSPPQFCGKKIFKKRPKVFIWQREKEDWFKSYWRWRRKNPVQGLVGYDGELWHPNWELDMVFLKTGFEDYDLFRQEVESKNPYYFDRMMDDYRHPYFDVTTFDFSNLYGTWKKFFDMIGFVQPLEWWLNAPKENATA